MRASYRVLGAGSILALAGGAFLACVGDEPSVAPIGVDEAGGGDSATTDASGNNDGTTPLVDGGDAGDASDAAPNATGTVTFAVKVIADNISGSGVAFDGLGNVFFAGAYLSSTAVDFGNGRSLPANTAGGNTYDGFVAKYDATGTCLWVSALTGSNEGNRIILSLAAAPNGEVVFAADLGASMTVKLDKATVASHGGSDEVALGRLDAAGKQVFLKTLASAGYEAPEAVAVDATGRIALTGKYIRNDPTIDPPFDGITANPPAHTNPLGYLALLSPLGVTQSLKAFPSNDGNPSSVVNPHAVAFSPDGNIVVGGEYTGSMDLRHGEAASQFVTSAGANDAWIAKIDATMNKVIWAVPFGGSGSDNIHGIGVDPSGNVTAAFNYGSALTVGGTAMLPAPGGNYDIGIVRFDPNGGMASGLSYGSSSTELPTKIVVDRWGEPIVVGLMAATISFGGKVANAYGATGSGDGFIAKLSPSGAGLWAYGIGGSDNNDQINAVAVDTQGNTACTGNLGGEGSPITLFGQTVNVGPGKNATFLVVTSP
jgi:hypothetical protein